MEMRRLPISGQFTFMSNDYPSDLRLPMCMYLLGRINDICPQEEECPKHLKVGCAGSAALDSLSIVLSCLQMTRTTRAFLPVTRQSQGCRDARRAIYDISTRSTEFSIS